jgi:hypothetical protein
MLFATVLPQLALWNTIFLHLVLSLRSALFFPVAAFYTWFLVRVQPYFFLLLLFTLGP